MSVIMKLYPMDAQESAGCLVTLDVEMQYMRANELTTADVKGRAKWSRFISVGLMLGERDSYQIITYSLSIRMIRP